MDFAKEYEKWVKFADDKLSAQDLTRIANDDEEIKSRLFLPFLNLARRVFAAG